GGHRRPGPGDRAAPPPRRPARSRGLERARPGAARLGAGSRPGHDGRGRVELPAEGNSMNADGGLATFRSLFGGTPEGVWAAPGRVNVIGEHTDYNDGFVLPIALPQGVLAYVSRRDDGQLRISSAQEPGLVESSVGDLA